MQVNNESFTLATWNILAPMFVRPPDKSAKFAQFEHVTDDAHLDWALRSDKIAQFLLRDAVSDVVTLQEVELTYDSEKATVLPPDWLREQQQANDFELVLQQFTPAEWAHQKDRNERVIGKPRVSCAATLFRKSAFELHHVESTSRTLAVFLKHRASQRIVCSINVHLEGHPDLSELRSKQLHSALKKARKVANSTVVVSGDFNNVNDQEMLKHDAEHGLLRLRTPPTYSSGSWTASVDHILLDEKCVRAVEIQDWFQRWEVAKAGIPNAHCPSDHSPLRVVLQLLEPPKVEPPKVIVVADERKKQIEESWAVIKAQQPVQQGKGKPDPATMEALKKFAVLKKDWLAQFANEELDHAKKISK